MFPKKLFLLLPLSLLAFPVFPITLRQIYSDGQTMVSTDFNPYLAGAVILRTGAGPQLYNLPFTVSIQKKLSSPYLYPRIPYRAAPTAALFYIPFSLLPFPIAYTVYLFFSLLLILSVSWLAYRTFFRNLPSWLFWGLIFGSTPILIGLLQGQLTALEYSLVTLSAIFWYRRQHLFSGLLLSLLFYKPHILIPIALVLFFSKNVRFFAGFTAGLILNLAVSLWIIGIPAALSYPKYLAATETPAYGTFFSGSSSILTAIPHFFSSSPLLSLLIFCFSLITFLIIIFITSGRSGHFSAPRLFSLAILLGLPFSFHTGHHDLGLLLLPIFYLFRRSRYLLASLLVIVSIPYRTSPVALIRAFVFLLIGLTLIPIPSKPRLAAIL